MSLREGGIKLLLRPTLNHYSLLTYGAAMNLCIHYHLLQREASPISAKSRVCLEHNTNS